MTYYLGIDQSYTSSGLVLVDYKGIVINHNVVSTLKSGGDYFYRAKQASEDIRSYVESLNVDLIVGIEGLAFSLRGHTLQNLAGLQFMIINAVRDSGYSIGVFTPSTVKKFATGSGKAKKEDMWEALPDKTKKMFEKIPKSQGREDLTDAYWIAMKTKHMMEG